MTANDWDWLSSLIRKLIEPGRVSCDDSSDSESADTAIGDDCEDTHSDTDRTRRDDAIAARSLNHPVAGDTRSTEAT